MTSRDSGDKIRDPNEIIAAYQRLRPPQQRLVQEGLRKFIDGFKEMWKVLKELLAEHSSDWSIGDDNELHFTPVILEACPGCGKLFSNPLTFCYQPDPLKLRSDWMTRYCNTKGDIYANGEKVDDIWGVG